MASNVPAQYLSTVVNDNTITLRSRDAGIGFHYFGSSVKASTTPSPESRYKTEGSVTFYLEEGEEGIIAIATTIMGADYKGRPNQIGSLAIFLKIGWIAGDDNKPAQPFIDLNSPWYPSLRIGHISKDEGVKVKVRGRWFSTMDANRFNTGERFDPTLPTHHPDGDLLCRYLFGKASSADVLHVVVQMKLGPSKEERYERLERSLRILKDRTDRVDHDNVSTQEFYGELWKSYDTLRTLAKNAKWLSDWLTKNPFVRFFQRDVAKDKAANFLRLYDEVIKPKLPEKIPT